MSMCESNSQLDKAGYIWRLACKYKKVTSRKDKSVIIDRLVDYGGYHRKYAISLLKTAVSPEIRRNRDMKKLAKKYTGGTKQFLDETIECLEIIYEASDYQNSKALVACMDMWVGKAVQFNWFDGINYTKTVESQLLKISHGSIDTHLKTYRKVNGLRGIPTTKPGTLLRNSLTIRKAGDEMEQRPGFLEGDTVAHCGNILKGSFIRTLTVTDVFTGWSENIAMQNNSHENIKQGLLLLETRFPFEVKGYDFDNGSEFINHDVVGMISSRDLSLTRARPYRSNDNAHVEQKNNDIVRRNLNYYRYDTNEELAIINQIYELNHLKFNLFTPTRKAIGHKEMKTKPGKMVREYDAPLTPYERVKCSGVLSSKQIKAFDKMIKELDPRAITNEKMQLRKTLFIG